MFVVSCIFILFYVFIMEMRVYHNHISYTTIHPFFLLLHTLPLPLCVISIALCCSLLIVVCIITSSFSFIPSCSHISSFAATEAVLLVIRTFSASILITWQSVCFPLLNFNEVFPRYNNNNNNMGGACYHVYLYACTTGVRHERREEKKM